MVRRRLVGVLVCVLVCSVGAVGCERSGGGSDVGASDTEASDGSADGGPGVDGRSVTCESLGYDAGESGGDYYVAKGGDDSNGGTSPGEAFATIQKGVDALSPGETLVIGPGEYRESVRRKGLGSSGATTTIRAEIPGTVVLRGDVPAPDFEQVRGRRFVHVADFDGSREVEAVNELDTHTVLERRPTVSGLEFTPGKFHQDKSAGKLYVSTSDMQPVSAHRYSVSVDPISGIYLPEAEKVVIEGIAVTGFHTNEELDPDKVRSHNAWGVLMPDAQDCVIRDVHAYLNGRGIGVDSRAEDAGGNVIEGSTAWGNSTPFGADGDIGAITLLNPEGDVVRESEAFLNSNYGINIRGGGKDGQKKDHQSFMRRNLSWGNGEADYKIKTGYAHIHRTVRSASPGSYANPTNPRHCLAGKKPRGAGRDTIVLNQEENLEPAKEFADPVHHDYRLQSNSRFRGALPDGSDRGPFPYEETVYYVAPSGDDTNDGLSIGEAWATLERAFEAVEPGDTVYLEPGVYRSDSTIESQGQPGNVVSVRGRGEKPVVLRGDVSLVDAAHLEFRRLNFAGAVEVESSRRIAFHNNRFLAEGIALWAPNTAGLAVTQSTFTGFDDAAVAVPCSEGVRLAGNLYDNAESVAVAVDDVDAIRHSDHNSYRNFEEVWEVGGRVWSHSRLRDGDERYAEEREPTFATENGVPRLQNTERFAGGGSLGRPFGRYRFEPRGDELRVAAGPEVHSVTATTANIEWHTTLPATVTLAWGPTEDVEKTVTLDARYFGAYSLTGLSPDTTYHVEIDSLNVPEEFNYEADSVTNTSGQVSFTTESSAPSSTTYYVDDDGSNSNAGTDPGQPWRTLQHAADRVGPGDTVVVSGGTYSESVRIRATGTESAPIAFRAEAGEKVVLEGANLALTKGIVTSGKNHLRFDGFFTKNFNKKNTFIRGWPLGAPGELHFYRGRDIHVTRLFSDGRGTTTAPGLRAAEVEDLLVRNSVFTNTHSNAVFSDVPGLRVENSVFARPMIVNFGLRNDADQSSRFVDNIFTDNLEKKADLNIWIFTVDRSMEGMVQKNNVYFLRDSPPLDRRNVFYRSTTLAEAQNQGYVVDPLYKPRSDANPKFKGVERLVSMGENRWEYPPDQLMRSGISLDFSSFFATNKTVTSRGIGLETSRFDANGLPNGP